MIADRLPETSFGFRKRFVFLADAVERTGASAVLDVGCGTGALVTAPLAERFPAATFTGVDPDPASIAFAQRELARPNLAFKLPHELDPAARFDLVIASEVLEHVDDPGEFLAGLGARLREGGSLALTTPNGYGPFEWASTVHAIAVLTGGDRLLRRAKRRLSGAPPAAREATDTLAYSPHVNFVSSRELRRVLRDAGFEVTCWRSRTLLCGYGLSALIREGRPARINAELADRLPAAFASDWMLLLRPNGTPATGAPYRRGAYGRAKRALSLRSAQVLRGRS